MKFETAAAHKINGTSLKGYIEADYKELVAVFGDHGNGDGYKVDAEWMIEFADGTVATIYNWKNGNNYCGEDGLPVECITHWHIGGHTERAEQLVNDVVVDFRNGCPTVDEKPTFLIAY